MEWHNGLPGTLSPGCRHGRRRAITIRGNGKSPAFCTRTLPPPIGGCFKDFPLGAAPAPIWNNLALRALRAVQFLQQRCPPQMLPF
jgi:hypothetical protein